MQLPELPDGWRWVDTVEPSDIHRTGYFASNMDKLIQVFERNGSVIVYNIQGEFVSTVPAKVITAVLMANGVSL